MSKIGFNKIKKPLLFTAPALIFFIIISVRSSFYFITIDSIISNPIICLFNFSNFSLEYFLNIIFDEISNIKILS